MGGAEIILYIIVLIITIGIILFFLSIIFKVEIKDLMPILVVESETAVILENRLGKDRVVYEGFRFYVPIVEVPKGDPVTLKEHQIDPPAHDVITKDDIKIEIDMIVSVKIKDPIKAILKVEDYQKSVNSLVMSSALNKLGLMNFEDIQKEQKNIAKEIKQEMKKDCDRWGVEVVLVEFENIARPKAVRESLEKEKVAKSEAQAAITKAEAQKKVKELQADGEKILIEKKAEAIVKTIRDLKDLMPNISDEKIMQFLTSNAYIDSVKELSTSDNSKFVLYPSDVNQPLDKVVNSEYLSNQAKS
jgi:regulator of protease activity HflC (stomatin/prohibitin superfamily)